jgi:DNA recombination protein RmuC
MHVLDLLIAVLTLLAGALIGWLAGASRTAAAGRAELAAASSEATRLEAVLGAERQAAGAREAAFARAAQTREEDLRRAAQAREADLAKADQRLREAFGNLSAEALQRNNEAFVALAESRLSAARTAADTDLAQRQLAIETLVDPLRSTLDKVQEQMSTVERSRAGSYATLMEQIATMRQSSEQLRVETSQLVTALRAPQVRGRWGELQLERTVEAAGMAEHIDYVTQASSSTEDGVLRPDMVVQLVGGKNVVVDSKVAFAGYLEAMEAKDESTRAARLKAHARHLRDHIDALAAKSYWERFAPSPEFVVCFVPADAFLDAALREEPGLLEHAFARNIVVATPSTLVALLRTVAYTWRQDALAANAVEVHTLGRELYQRLSTMGAHIDKLGRSLGTAVSSYNSAVSSIESRVLVTARKMSELKVVGPGEQIEPPRQITEFARSAQAAEFADSRVVALAKPKAVADQATLLDPTGRTGT